MRMLVDGRAVLLPKAPETYTAYGVLFVLAHARSLGQNALDQMAT